MQVAQTDTTADSVCPVHTRALSLKATGVSEKAGFQATAASDRISSRSQRERFDVVAPCRISRLSTGGCGPQTKEQEGQQKAAVYAGLVKFLGRATHGTSNSAGVSRSPWSGGDARQGAGTKRGSVDSPVSSIACAFRFRRQVPSRGSPGNPAPTVGTRDHVGSRGPKSGA